jgi:hypothetical protein
LTALFVLTSAAHADDQPEKKAEPEKIPAPKVVEQPPIVIIEPAPYQRTDTRDVWQNYGVNSFGRFVPRVINTPYGYYYSRDLEPYPWAGTRPRLFRP